VKSPMILHANLVLALAIGLTLLTGCGVYTFNPRGESSFSSIAVEPFENETSQYGLADQMTEYVIDAFIADGNLKVVSSDVADALLIGKLTFYERQVEKFDENDQVEEYKAVMDFQITLQNPKDQSEMWSEKVRQEGIYEADTETEEDGQRRAGERLVEFVLNRTTKSW
jgi:hypothetical protein